MPVGPPQPIDRHEEFLAAILTELRAIRAAMGGPALSPPANHVELREPQKVANVPARFQQPQKQYRR